MPLITAIESHQVELHGGPAVGAASAVFQTATHFLGADDDVAPAAEAAAQAITFLDADPQKARGAYTAFRAQIGSVPARALPAFLSVALVPLLLKKSSAPQWRRQIALARAAWFGFPKL
jgi:hypothetical protein